jgi:hypothetical protein
MNSPIFVTMRSMFESKSREKSQADGGRRRIANPSQPEDVDVTPSFCVHPLPIQSQSQSQSQSIDSIRFPYRSDCAPTTPVLPTSPRYSPGRSSGPCRSNVHVPIATPPRPHPGFAAHAAPPRRVSPALKRSGGGREPDNQGPRGGGRGGHGRRAGEDTGG